MGNAQPAPCICKNDELIEYIPPVFGQCCKKDPSKASVVMEVPVYSVDPGESGSAFGIQGALARNPDMFRPPQASSPRTGPGQKAPSQQKMVNQGGGVGNESLAEMQAMEDKLHASAAGGPGSGAGKAAGGSPRQVEEVEAKPRSPAQCGCCPSALDKPTELQVLERNWCCYSCCAGFGCKCKDVDPLVCTSSCGCAHTACETTDLWDPMQGLFSQMITCCLANYIVTFPIPTGAPLCICCNEKFLFRGNLLGPRPPKTDKEAGDQQFGVATPPEYKGRRASIVETKQEVAFVLSNRMVACFCCCCGCTEAYGRNVCNTASKCCCYRCEQRWGQPCFPGCACMSLCAGPYCQCRLPCLPDTPCCMCFGKPIEISPDAILDFCLPSRMPQCCETCKCCSLSDFCSRLCNCFDYFAPTTPPIDYSTDRSWEVDTDQMPTEADPGAVPDINQQ